jgi:hypothetical protein
MDKLTIPDVLPIFQDFIRRNPAGGSLHIVLDDWNLEDDHIKYCINYAKECNDNEAVKLGEIMLQLSMTQRNKLVNKI